MVKKQNEKTEWLVNENIAEAMSKLGKQKLAVRLILKELAETELNIHEQEKSIWRLIIEQNKEIAKMTENGYILTFKPEEKKVVLIGKEDLTEEEKEKIRKEYSISN